jgi:hypothetical protein
MAEPSAVREGAAMKQSHQLDLEVLTPTERDQVERWRAGQLERAGFDVSLARTLAARLDIDLHEAIELITSGCPPELALRILL